MAPGIWQILIVIVLITLLFGAGRVPAIMENLAKGINSFKKGLKDDGTDEKKAIEDKAKDKNDTPQG